MWGKGKFRSEKLLAWARPDRVVHSFCDERAGPPVRVNHVSVTWCLDLPPMLLLPWA